VTTLEEAAALARNERGLVIVATLRGDGTIQSSLVNAGIVPHPVTGESTLAFVTNGPVKLANLRARPQVTATFRQRLAVGSSRRTRRAGWAGRSPSLARPRTTPPTAPRDLPRCRRRARRLGHLRPGHGRGTPRAAVLVRPDRFYTNR
jgi:hypothetical protein